MPVNCGFCRVNHPVTIARIGRGGRGRKVQEWCSLRFWRGKVEKGGAESEKRHGFGLVGLVRRPRTAYVIGITASKWLSNDNHCRLRRRHADVRLSNTEVWLRCLTRMGVLAWSCIADL